MKIYLDDNLSDPVLVGLLRKAGHSVTRPVDAGLLGVSDPRHLEYALRAELVTLTSDGQDFEDLHQLILTSGGSHPGIMVVRFDNDPKRDMQPKHIAAAVTKLERSGMDLRNQLVLLNHWR